MVKFSIIITTFNRHNLLHYVLKCLEMQTYHNFIIHLIDNGSSLPVDEATFPPSLDIVFTRYEINQNPNEVINKEIKKLSGTHFAWLGDDDLWVASALDRIAQVFSNRAIEMLSVGFSNYSHEKQMLLSGKEYFQRFSGQLFRYNAYRMALGFCNSWGIGRKETFLIPPMSHSSTFFLSIPLIARTLDRQGELFVEPFGDVGMMGCCFYTDYAYYLDEPLGIIGVVNKRAMNGALPGQRFLWNSKIPSLRYSPVKGSTFINMGMESHLKILYLNNIHKKWDCFLRSDFFLPQDRVASLPHLVHIATDKPWTETTVKDIDEALPLAIESVMRENRLAGVGAKHELYSQIMARLENIRHRVISDETERQGYSPVSLTGNFHRFADTSELLQWQDRRVILLSKPSERNKLTINVVYAHLPAQNMHSIHRGRLSIVWSHLPIEGCDHYVYANAVSFRGKLPGLNILTMLEPVVVLPGEYDERVWKYFDYIFCPFDALTQNRKFCKMLFPRADGYIEELVTEQQDQRDAHYPLSGRKNAICMIGGNKKSHVPSELYSKRIEVAEWFFKNSAIPFDVYGRPPFQLSNYRGIIPSGQKLSILKQYRFSLCFENTNHPVLSAGYVTEKILDCLETRTIPIYLGASNIEKYIPEDCLIDFRKFDGLDDLDKYLQRMTQKEYRKRVSAIDAWVSGGNLRKYSWIPFYDMVSELCASASSASLERLFDGHTTWSRGKASNPMVRRFQFSELPIMWSWSHLSKAAPPAVENGIVINRLNRNTDESYHEDATLREHRSILSKTKPSLKVMTAGGKFFSGNASRGYDYSWWNVHDALHRFMNIETQFFDFATEAQRRGVAGMSERLEEIIRNEKPDVFLYSPIQGPVGILPASLELIASERDILTVVLLFGHRIDTIDEAKFCGAYADYVIVTSPETAKLFAQAGFGAKVIRSQWGFNHFTYAPKPSPRMRHISFCGAAKGNRSETLEKIMQNGLSVDVFGPGWHEDSFLPFYDMVQVFSESKISLNLIEESVREAQEQINARVFEVAGCRGFLLTTPAEGLEEYYEPEKEVVVARSQEEMIDKSKYYLIHDRERETIAQRGYQRTLAEHTWAHRLMDIFEQFGFRATPLAAPAIKPLPLWQSKVSIPEDTMSSAHDAQASNNWGNNADVQISIIVNAYNQLQYTKKCVESVLNYTTNSYELILSDNGSTDGTFDYFKAVKKFHPHTKVLRNFQNRIVETTLNNAVSIACGKYIVFVSNDNLVHEGWLDNLIRHIESAPDIGMVGPRSNNISGPQAASGEYGTQEIFQSFAADWSKKHQGESFTVERMVGMLFLTRKDILERIGAFDPELPTNGKNGGYGFSDDDLSLRLRVAGYKLLVANDVFIHHFGSVTVRQHRPDLFGAHQNLNKEEYMRKICNNSRITIGSAGTIALRPYSMDDAIPVDERMAISIPRICFVETGGGLPITAEAESRYAALVSKYYGGYFAQRRDESIQSLILKILDETVYDFLVLIESRLAPTPETISALTESALCYPDVAVMVPVGNYAPTTHSHGRDWTREVETIPYADMSLCVVNLRIVRPLRPGLAKCKTDDELLWFLQRRVRGESYFIAKANDIIVNLETANLGHPYDTYTLPEQLVRERKYKEALTVYKHDVRRDPTFAESYYQLACIAKEKYQIAEAIEHAEQALKADPHKIEVLLLLSRLFIEQNNWKRAEAFIRQANFKQPGNPNVQKIVEQYEEAAKDKPDLFKTAKACRIPVLNKAEFIGNETSIIVTASSNHARECLSAIKRNTKEPYELIVVDTLTSPDSKKKLRKSVKEHSQYKILEHHPPTPPLQSLNQGINFSTGEYIALLTDDVIVSTGWLSGMLECLNNQADTGVIGPVTNHADGPQQVKDDRYRASGQLDTYAPQFQSAYRHRRIPLPNIEGFCMLFRRDLVHKIGLLDESFSSGMFAGKDLCLRARLEGYRNLIAGDVFVHRHDSTSVVRDRTGFKALTARERKVFKEKWTGIDFQSLPGKKLFVQKAMEKADELIQRNEINQAIEVYLQAIGHSPEENKLYCALAERLIEAKRFSDAFEALNEMPSDARDARTIELMGYCKEGLDQYDEAEKLADRALELNPASASALNLKGVLAYKQGNTAGAQAFFKQAVAVDPGYGEPYTNLGVLEWTVGHTDEGFRLLERGFVLSPTVLDIAAPYHSAVTAQAAFESAERIFRDACALHPAHKRLMFLLIDILLQQSKYDEAMGLVEEAMLAFGTDEDMIAAALQIRSKIGEKRVDNESKKITLSLCMIVKNEEKHLARCLSSVKLLADELIVVDTGSSDRTVDIAKVFGAQVYNFEWTNHFADARNFSLSKAAGNWILVMDADEVLSSSDHRVLLGLVQKRSQQPVAYSFTTRNYVVNVAIRGWHANDGKYCKEEAGTGWHPSTKVRLFPNDRRIHFQGHVHELLEPSLNIIGIKIKECSVPIHHYGHLDKDKSVSKGQEYYLLGKAKLETNAGDIQSLIELARQAGGLGEFEDSLQLWQKVIDLNPTNAEAFLNLGHSCLELGRYEEALTASKKAIELDPTLKEAVLNYSVCELAIGEVANAILALENLLKKFPEYPVAMGNLAVAYCIHNDKDNGLKYLNEIKKKGFDCGLTLCGHARRFMSVGRTDYATVLLEVALEGNYANKEVLQLLAECHRIRESAAKSGNP